MDIKKSQHSILGGKRQYISNEELMALIIEYHKTKSKVAYNEIGKRFLLIARNVMRNTCFINYSYQNQQDMIGDAVYLSSKYFPNWRIDFIPNPFSFFTRITWNAYKNYIRIYKKKTNPCVSINEDSMSVIDRMQKSPLEHDWSKKTKARYVILDSSITLPIVKRDCVCRHPDMNSNPPDSYSEGLRNQPLCMMVGSETCDDCPDIESILKLHK